MDNKGKLSWNIVQTDDFPEDLEYVLAIGCLVYDIGTENECPSDYFMTTVKFVRSIGWMTIPEGKPFVCCFWTKLPAVLDKNWKMLPF